MSNASKSSKSSSANGGRLPPGVVAPEHRLEGELADKKPLYSEAEARAEAERCLERCPTRSS